MKQRTEAEEIVRAVHKKRDDMTKEQSHQDASVRSLNERFTVIADKVSEMLGMWWFSILSLLLLMLWTLYGLFIISQQAGGGWFTSPQWNFPLNTITTVGEWFIGALVAAAANRVERNNLSLQQHQMQIVKHINATNEKEEGQLSETEQHLLAQDNQMLSILLRLDQQEHMILRIVERLEARP